ncbi:MAG: isopenicillin N synthase family oxygenase [Geminicoccaceae bacterium]|nr:isopenicillin N synthase family oxygenase [Geminicoccaceae bacterium]
MTIPVIDLDRLEREGGLEAAAAAIGAACREIGFFYLVGHGIEEAARERVFAAARAFFALPPDAKEAVSIARSPHNRGYVGLAVEALDPRRGGDRKEAFNIGLELAPDDPELAAGIPFRGLNQWPDLPGFRETLLAWFDACWALGRRLHRAIARDLGLAPDFFEPVLDRPMATLRLLHYPPADPSAPEAPGAGEHTDYGNLTLLATEAVGGLEVRRRDGAWIAAPFVPGAFVCNIGDCLERWTNGVYRSTPHRVASPRGRDRYSIAFSLDPNPDALVACLPSCTGPGRPARFPPIHAADHLRARLEATYGPAAG